MQTAGSEAHQLALKPTLLHPRLSQLAGSEAHPALFQTLLASPEDLHAVSMAHFLCGNGHCPLRGCPHTTKITKFNINETSETVGIADHVTLLRLFFILRWERKAIIQLCHSANLDNLCYSQPFTTCYSILSPSISFCNVAGLHKGSYCIPPPIYIMVYWVFLSFIGQIVLKL